MCHKSGMTFKKKTCHHLKAPCYREASYHNDMLQAFLSGSCRVPQNVSQLQLRVSELVFVTQFVGLFSS